MQLASVSDKRSPTTIWNSNSIPGTADTCVLLAALSASTTGYGGHGSTAGCQNHSGEQHLHVLPHTLGKHWQSIREQATIVLGQGKHAADLLAGLSQSLP
jgi:hypothetical protein